jgi:hypothetical protein
MRFTSGIIVGFGAGYYLGTKAGRERYQDIERWLDQVKATDTYQGGKDRLLTVAFTRGAPILEALDGATDGKASMLIDRIASGSSSPDPAPAPAPAPGEPVTVPDDEPTA